MKTSDIEILLKQAVVELNTGNNRLAGSLARSAAVALHSVERMPLRLGTEMPVWPKGNGELVVRHDTAYCVEMDYSVRTLDYTHKDIVLAGMVWGVDRLLAMRDSYIHLPPDHPTFVVGMRR